MIRDPRDVICSAHAQTPGSYYVGADIFLRQLAMLRPVRNHPRLALVRYEDLVTDPAGVQSEMEEWLGDMIDFEAPFEEWHTRSRVSEDAAKALGDVRSISTSSVGAWREHPERMASQIRRHPRLVEVVQELGYEPDDAWLASLDLEANSDTDLPPAVEPGRRSRTTGERLAKVPRYLRLLASGGLSA
jgi:hypothetical protein